MADSTLDQDFLAAGESIKALRESVDRAIADAGRETLTAIAEAMSRMRDAANVSEWNAAVDQAREKFAGQMEALELLAGIAALTAPQPASAENLNEAGARRFARVRVAEIQLYHASEVKAGRAARDLYGALQPHIDAARLAFQEKYLSNGTPTADYLHSELLRALANDDTTLLGPGYPGPLA